MPQSARDAAKDLCIRAGMSEVKAAATVRELDKQRAAYSRASAASERRMYSNLLQFYGERKQAGVSRFPLCEEYAQIVFSIHVASAVIETYFSKTKYIKNKHRPRLSDKSAAASLHLASLKTSTPNVLQRNRETEIDFRAAWKTGEDDEDDLKDKYVGKRVCKNFENEETGEMTPYSGTITHVHFVQDTSQYMMHVSYDDDDDSEDYEEYEVKEYLVEDD